MLWTHEDCNLVPAAVSTISFRIASKMWARCANRKSFSNFSKELHRKNDGREKLAATAAKNRNANGLLAEQVNGAEMFESISKNENETENDMCPLLRLGRNNLLLVRAQRRRFACGVRVF